MTADVHTLVGAYVLDAVDPAEAALVENHLAACTACVEEVASLRTAAGVLASDAASKPPAWLRERLVAEIARTPQLAPRPELSLPDLTPSPAPLPTQSQELPPGPPAGPPSPGAQDPMPVLLPFPPRPQLASRPELQPQLQPHLPPQPQLPLQVLAPPPGAEAAAVARRRQPSRRPLVGLAAALAAVCLGLGFVVTDQRGDLRTEQARVEALSALTDAAFESSAAVPVEGGGQIAVVSAGDESLLVTRALPNLPPGKTYQLWLQDETSAIRSVGVLGGAGNRQDERLVTLAGLTSKDIKLCVTVEPEGGSMQPTTPVLAAVNLNAGRPN